MTEVIAECAPQAVPAILSGPSFAADVARGPADRCDPRGGDDEEGGAMLSRSLGSATFRPYHSTDRSRGHSGRQAARHVGRKARSGQDRRHRLGGAFGDDLVMNRRGGALNALGAGHDRGAGCNPPRQAGERAAQGLGWYDRQDGVALRRGFTQRCNGHAFVDGNAGQMRAFAGGPYHAGRRDVACHERHRTAGAGDGVGQRGAPGTGADDGDTVGYCAHAAADGLLSVAAGAGSAGDSADAAG